ncbi:TM2 domain-containing protein [Gemella sp. GH3]|uniref:TM2 domain-containing protein n=1 Tax=unclassified Gemella TaxID=2624949 RepID=UPI00351B212C
MAKILKVNVTTTTIGLDNGEILEIDTPSLDFIPKEDDEVEGFKSDSKIYVNKIENTNNTGKAVNKVSYVLLAFLLGGIGAHKFYAGKIGLGILYFVSCIMFYIYPRFYSSNRSYNRIN